MFKYIVATVAFVVSAGSVMAQDLAIRYESYQVRYELREDATYLATYSWQAKVLNRQGLDFARQASFGHSASVEKSKIISAYTIKPDGKKIEAPPGNFQVETNSGVDGKPAFSDFVKTTVVFAELAVGDSIYLSYSVDTTEAIFPKMFSVAHYFPREQEYDNVTVQVVSPATMWAQYKASDMAQRVSEVDGRRTVEWTLSNPKGLKTERRNYSVFDPVSLPNLSFSTFRNYGEIAEAYGARARPKAVPSERVKKLAEQLTLGKVGDKEKVRTLYEWVATNIVFAGNCIGVGAVVPRDQDFVIENKMGDCKDHATLLQAMLAAVNIKSTQVLVNSGNVYKLPAIPVAANVNHVLTYVPSLNMYMDSTSDSTPFGMLPMGDEGKTVLHVDSYKDGVVTPVTQPGTNFQGLKMNVDFAADGSAKGFLEVMLKGHFATTTRAMFRRFQPDDQRKFVKNTLRNYRLQGDGAISFEDPVPLSNEFSYSVQFTVEGLLVADGGTLSIDPMFWTPAPVMRMLTSEDEVELDFDTFCTNGQSTEEYKLTLPSTTQITSLPKSANLKDALIDYSVTYKLDGSTLMVSRAVDDRTPGNVCGPAIKRPYYKAASRALQTTRSQVLYK
jgi:Domain of Unknown Function with PDB structure (DUF3857)/Transglutaminase-like superfamily